MDIEGKHFPDEEEEGKSKTAKRVGKYCFRFLAVCSAVVYIFCFIRIFSSCDAPLLEEVKFSDKAVQMYYDSPKDFVTYQIYTKDFMEHFGRITLSNIVYAETAGEIEIGIKYNPKITENDNYSNEIADFPLVYKLTDKNGNEFKICNRVNTQKGSYKFERVCFEGLKMDFTYNYLNTGENYASGEGVWFETEDSSGGEKYTLEIYNPITNESNKFVIYDNNTPYETYEYKPN